MQDRQDRVLSVEEAAAILYGSDQPTHQQLAEVRNKLARRHLEPSAEGQWTTTVGGVAAYLERRAQQTRKRARVRTSEPPRPTRSPRPASDGRAAEHRVRGSKGLSLLYREVLLDYVLAVVTRRSSRFQSRAWDRAVLVGQVVCLALVVGTLLSAYRYAFERVPPERVIVERWIEGNLGRFSVVEWFAPQPAIDGSGTTIRVRIRYFSSKGKGIVTDRVFLVRNERVVTVQFTE